MILSLANLDDKQNDTIFRKFKRKLQQWKAEQSVDSDRRRQEPYGSVASTLTTTNTDVSEVHMRNKNTPTAYTKTLTLSSDNPNLNVKFFNNPLFGPKLQEHLSQTYNIKCSIGLERQNVILTLIGAKQQVKASCNDIKSLFETMTTKLFNSESTDSKVISWSKDILSGATVNVIQQIMDNEKIFTVWKKTEMFSGYYQVMYFTHQTFAVYEDNITKILTRRIAYVEGVELPIKKTKNFIDEVEQFIIAQKQPELTIIYCKYPYQMEIQVNLFGRKKLVHTVKQQLQSIVHKHTLKAFQIKMTLCQYNFLLDNCLRELKDIENDYADDNVEIRIRQKEFYAPQYLIEKIKQHVNDLINQTAVCVIQKIGHSTSPIDEETIVQLNQIARRHYCRIEKTESKIEMQVHSVPKALAKTSLSSKNTIEQSNVFCSSLSVRKISILNGSIEIHTTAHPTSLLKDVTVITTDARAIEEGIGSGNGNGLFEMPTGRKILFLRWSLAQLEGDNANVKVKRSVEKLISSVTQNIIINCPDAEIIAFLANEWEDFRYGPQLAELFIEGMKREIETKKSHWRVLFIFHNEQSQLRKEFLQTMIRLQSDEDGFVQFLASISKTYITLTTAKGNNTTRCENEVNTYIPNNISITKILINASDLGKWDQQMINTFYKYCLEKSVLPKIDLINNQLQLTGSVQDVEKATQKYKLISEIMTLKSPVRITSSVAARSSVAGTNQLNPVSDSGYNIAFSYSPQDEAVCNHLATLLVDEGYSLCQSSSSTFLSQSHIKRSDLLLTYFSENYSQDARCMTDLNYAKSKGKKIIPIVTTKNISQDAEENSWLHSMTNAQLFYDMFDTEIEIEFTGNYDLEYDKLLIILLRYTKPGVTGQIYPLPRIISKPNNSETNHERGKFGHTLMKLPKITDEEQKKTDEPLLKKQNISNNELYNSAGDPTFVVEDLEKILYDYTNPDDHSGNSISGNDTEYSQNFVGTSLYCAKRQLNRSSTGDPNNDLLSEHRTTHWEKDNYVRSEDLPQEGYFSMPILNEDSWFTNEQAHNYIQLLIKAERGNDPFKTEIEKNEVVWQDDISITEVDSEDGEGEIDSEWRTPEEIRKIQDLDNLNRKWKRKKPVTEAFMKQKIRNIIEFQQLCDSYSNS